MHEKLPIPDCPEVLAFRAVVNVIRSDPTLRRLNVTFIVWDGSPNDLTDPVASLLPFIELQPSPNGTGWAEADQHRSDVGVDVTIAIKGTNADDLLNLWGVLRSALFPDPALSQRATVEAAMTGGQSLPTAVELGPLRDRVTVDELLSEHDWSFARKRASAQAFPEPPPW